MIKSSKLNKFSSFELGKSLTRNEMKNVNGGLNICAACRATYDSCAQAGGSYWQNPGCGGCGCSYGAHPPQV